MSTRPNSMSSRRVVAFIMKPPGARRWFASFTEENKRHAFVRDFASLPRGRFALVEKEDFPRERASALEMPRADRLVARRLSIRKSREAEWHEGNRPGLARRHRRPRTALGPRQVIQGVAV